MPGMVMVYSPRDLADLEVVGEIIRASADYASADQ